MELSDMTPTEAMRYLGISDEAELERIVLEYDVDVDVGTDGHVTAIDGETVRHALFEEHRKNVGHRPDDPEERMKARAHEKRNVENRRRARAGRRDRLVKRMKAEGRA